MFKKLTLVMLATLMVSATTLSFAQTKTSKESEHVATAVSVPRGVDLAGDVAKEYQKSNEVGILGAVNPHDLVAIGKDAIDGDGFDWITLLLAIVPSIFLGAGWLLQKWDSKNKSILLAAAYEGGEAVTAGLTYLATRRKDDFDKAVKEAKDVILVPRSMMNKKG